MKLPAIFRKDGPAPVAAPALPPLPPAQAAGPALPPKRSSFLASSSSVARHRLLIGFDATASREPTWKQSGRLMNTLLATLPGQLEVALAVHGGSRLHTGTRYTTNSGKLRDKASGIRCEGGYTKLLDMLSHQVALAADVVVYVGDCFEESARQAGKIADKLGKRGTRVIILQEGENGCARDVFAEIAERTGGALLPFDISSFDRIGKELLELIAVLAVEGVEAVEAKQDTAPAARLLLENLDPGRLLIGRG